MHPSGCWKQAQTHATRGFKPEKPKIKSKVRKVIENGSQEEVGMARKKTSEKSSTQYLSETSVVRLERLAERLGVAQGRVLDVLLSARTDEQLAGFAEAQQYAANPSLPVPVLLDGPVVASMSGAIASSVSSLLGSALPDLVLQVLAAQAERDSAAFAGMVEPVIERVVPRVLDRLIAEISKTEAPQ